MFDYVVGDISSSASASASSHAISRVLAERRLSRSVIRIVAHWSQRQAVRILPAHRDVSPRHVDLRAPANGRQKKSPGTLATEEMAAAAADASRTSRKVKRSNSTRSRAKAAQIHARRIVANNRHARFGALHPEPDSDGDGITDEDEREMGLDETNPDTDGDGLRDGIELMVGRHADSRTAPAITSNSTPMATDFDCEEKIVGTNARDPDTDGDGLRDDIEFSSAAPRCPQIHR